MTAPSSCPRLAPTARSRASSRSLPASTIVNVLKIRKLPTSSATTANTSSAIEKMSTNVAIAACCSSATSAAVSTE
jgi:hypothetical protein